MKEWYSEESHVKKFLNTMVEILFQKIPFSRRAEEAKQILWKKPGSWLDIQEQIWQICREKII